MKKLILILVAMVMLFNITGCNSGPTYDSNNPIESLNLMESTLSGHAEILSFHEEVALVFDVRTAKLYSKNKILNQLKKQANSRELWFNTFRTTKKEKDEINNEVRKSMHGMSVDDIKDEASKYIPMSGQEIMNSL